MRKCEEISRLGGAKDGGREMPRGRGGGLLFSLLLLLLFVSWLVSCFYLFLSYCIFSHPPDSTLTLIANGLQNWVVFFLIFFNAPSAGGFILTRVNAREPQTFRLTARVRFFFKFLTGFHRAKRRRF